jgi:hypothetical protein
MAQLMKVVCGDQGLTAINFITYIINEIHNERDLCKAVEMAGTAF